MRIRVYILALAAIFLAMPAASASFEATLKVAEEPVVLVGRGDLSKWMIKGCDMAFYTSTDSSRSELLGDIPHVLEFVYARNIKAEQFASTAWKTLRRNWSDSHLEKLKPEIDDLHSLFRDVQKGDRYRLIYLPGEGIELVLNGQSLGRVGDKELGETYFSIWLGDDPLDHKLKKRLISGMK